MIVNKKKIARSILIAVSIVLVVSAAGIALSLVQFPVAIPTAGAVKGVGVAIYWDLACTSPVYSIGWGTIDSGTSHSEILYVKNTGNTAATLTKTVRNWSPTTAISYLTVSWNYANQVVGVNKVQPVTVTLTALSNATALTSFNFDLIITASG